MSGKCDTRYPIMLVHGVSSSDRIPYRAWGRIPRTLMENGARVYFGGQDSWATIEKNAEMLNERIADILSETGCGKVNIIAHSKGGLDSRRCISAHEMGAYVASLTTISTPHHGVRTMDTLSKLPMRIYKGVGFFVDRMFKFIGDVDPDFVNTCHQWTTDNMRRFNDANPDAPHVYYQSYAAVMSSPLSDVLLSVPYLITYCFEGKNDGIVPELSTRWGTYRGELHSAGLRGISHADAVDFRRDSFYVKARGTGIIDILEVYIDIVSELKAMGF